MAYIQAEWYGRKCLDCGRIEDCEGECSRKGYFRFETVHVIHIAPGRKPQCSESTK
jgi:hypothetical protein